MMTEGELRANQECYWGGHPHSIPPGEAAQIAIAAAMMMTREFERMANAFEHGDPLVDGFFQELVEHQHGHREYLEKRCGNRWGGSQAMLVGQEIEDILDAAASPHPGPFGLESTLPLMALWTSIRAKRWLQELYRALAAVTSDVELRHILLDSESFEADHIHDLKRRIARLTQVN